MLKIPFILYSSRSNCKEVYIVMYVCMHILYITARQMYFLYCAGVKYRMAYLKFVNCEY